MSVRVLYVFVVMMLLSHCINSLTRPSFIEFVDNGYSGITVAIHSQVQESQALLERIQASISLIKQLN